VKKATRPLLGYLTEAELAHVLAQMDRTTIDGERDMCCSLCCTTPALESKSCWI
jgi:hypothetical protein